MTKTELANAVKRYADVNNAIKAEINKLDPGLQKPVIEQRKREIRGRHAEELEALRRTIEAGKAHFQALRLQASDPMNAVFTAALEQGEKYSPAQALVGESLKLMTPASMVAFATRTGSPHLTIAAMNALQGMDLEGGDLARLKNGLQDTAKRFVKLNHVKEHAEMERMCAQVFVETAQAPEDRLTLGRELAALDQIMAQ
jgi:hypothetical protein